MSEIEAIDWNGYYVVSTFSGCGGSCLGYRMAGYRVLWASEFVPAAQEVYKLNHPNSILDTRDIRTVDPQDILDAIGLKVGEIDILDGSPPCASFSTAGKREKGWGDVKAYSDTKQRTDDLFFEYARILKGVQPKVFVAENVSGLVKGVAKGYFKQILAALKACGYNVTARLLDAQWLGVPQMRQRIIFIGVRNDIGLESKFPEPLKYRYSVKEAWENGDLSGEYRELGEDSVYRKLWHLTKEGDKEGLSKASKRLLGKNSYITHYKVDRSIPCNTITQGTIQIYHYDKARSLTIPELKRICAFPDDFQLTGTYAQQWERLGRAVPPVMMQAIAQTIRDEVLCKIPS
jgi:DNA (cytosine-5)-methyltransferase 1